mmetsp:Transcript_65214/g.201902  ORF Transcript_65214/g.201902 Transcript_65214/m.201902 type:complete len:229 (+) Transcript_65214:167-853(+)
MVLRQEGARAPLHGHQPAVHAMEDEGDRGQVFPQPGDHGLRGLACSPRAPPGALGGPGPPALRREPQDDVEDRGVEGKELLPRAPGGRLAAQQPAPARVQGRLCAPPQPSADCRRRAPQEQRVRVEPRADPQRRDALSLAAARLERPPHAQAFLLCELPVKVDDKGFALPIEGLQEPTHPAKAHLWARRGVEGSGLQEGRGDEVLDKVVVAGEHLRAEPPLAQARGAR